MGLIVKDNDYLQYAMALVQGAKKEICLSSFKLEISDTPRGRALKEYFQKIVERMKEGVKVKILFNWHDDRRSVAKTNYYASQFLKSAGVDIRFLKANRCCHAKILIIDKEKILLGSHNLSVRSTQNNFEISYLIDNVETAKELGAIFDSLFADAKPV